MSMLQELIAAGTPPTISTPYPTRQNPDRQTPAREVMCPKCGTWERLTHNSYCTGCLIKLAFIEQPAPAVETPEPVAQKAAEPVEEVWDFRNDEPYVAPNEELSVETLAMCAASTDLLILDEPLALDALPSWMEPSIEASENATEAEPGPVEEPAPMKPEQKAYFVTWVRDENQKAKYCLLHRKQDGMAVDCSCPDRKFRGRKNGRCCKHMTAHNNMITPAKKIEKAA